MDTFQRVLTQLPVMLELFRDGAGGNTQEFHHFVESRLRTSAQTGSN